jgi:hypothetical protein
MKAAAEYTDPRGKTFIFLKIAGEFRCYIKDDQGYLRRSRNWDIYPPHTQTTLLRVMAWLKMDHEIKTNPWQDTRFRFGNLNSCSDCPQFAC